MPVSGPYVWRLSFAVERVIDADTIAGFVTLPVKLAIEPMDLNELLGQLPFPIVVRLEGVNAPEDETPEGKDASAWVESWLDWAGEVYLLTNGKREKYGRWLGDIQIGERRLTKSLVEAGYAVVKDYR